MFARWKLWTIALLAVFLTWFTIEPAQAYSWSDIITHSDTAGNGTLQINYRIRLGYSVGFYLESVRIIADPGSANFAGIDGHGLWCMNDNSTIVFQKTGAETNLSPGEKRAWDTEISMPSTSYLKCGWSWTENYYIGGVINQCARILIYHDEVDRPGC